MPSGYWKDYMASSFASGSGTESSPYIIKTAAQLARILNYSNTRTTYYYKIDSSVTSIDMSAHYWNGFYCQNGYGIVFDGNNKTISGLYCKDDGSYPNYVGFISYGSRSATRRIENVIFKDCTAEGTGTSCAVGIVCGNIEYCRLSNICVINPYICGTARDAGCVCGNIDFRYDTSNIYVADINSSLSYNLHVTALRIGGVFGTMGNSGSGKYLLRGTSVSNISIYTSRADSYVGGIAGSSARGAVAIGCSVKFNVSIYAACTLGGIYGIGGGVSSSSPSCCVDMFYYIHPTAVSSSTIGIAVGTYQNVTPSYSFHYSITHYNTEGLTSLCDTSDGVNGYDYSETWNKDVLLSTSKFATRLWNVARLMGEAYTIDDNGAIVYMFDLANTIISKPYPVALISIWFADDGYLEDKNIGNYDISFRPDNVVTDGIVSFLTKTDEFMVPYPTSPNSITSINFHQYGQPSPQYDSGDYIYAFSGNLSLVPSSCTKASAYEFMNAGGNIVEAETVYYKNASGNLAKGERTYYKKDSSTLV